MATQEQIQLFNQAVVDQLSTPGMEKKAESSFTDYTRTKIYEEGFMRHFLPPETVTKERFDRQVDTPKPVIIVDKQADSPVAMSVPFGTLPRNVYLKSPRYAVTLARIVTSRFQADQAELLTNHIDIRQQVSDQSMRQIQAEEDTQFLRAANAIMVGADTALSYNGAQPLWETIPGGITRDSLAEAKKTMSRGPSGLAPAKALVNNVTVREFEKMRRDEIGGDLAQDIMKNGFSETHFAGLDWYVTIKRALVGDDTVYMFADPSFLGKNYMYEDVTMYLKKEAFMIQWFAYQTSGSAFGNATGVTRSDFA